jgi:hypothetical protein
MAIQSLAGLLESLSLALGIPNAAGQAFRFLQCFASNNGTASCHNAVSSYGPPFELSFSSHDKLPFLRLLGEVVEPGEALISRSTRAVATLDALQACFFPDRCSDALRHQIGLLLPPSEEFGCLDWPFVLWFGLRTDGDRTAIRCYANLQWRQWGHRLLRTKQFLDQTGNSNCSLLVDVLANDLCSWAVPVGLCFDLTSDGIQPARLHFSPTRVTVRSMHRLLDHLGLEDRLDEVFDFIDIFESRLSRSDIPPILLSVNLEPNHPDVKFDITLDKADSSESLETTLSHCETRFGPINGFDNARDLLLVEHNSRIRYTGLTVRKGIPAYLNIYLSCPSLLETKRSGHACMSRAFSFCAESLDKWGTLLMEPVGLPGARRSVPNDWPDIYASSLAQQLVWEGHGEVAERLSSITLESLLRAEKVTGCCFLPGFPQDADDLSMLALSKCISNTEVPESITKKIRQAQSSGGGFRTFLQDDEDPHEAVTLNALNALYSLGSKCEFHDEARNYMASWFAKPDFPDCRWMHSASFTLYLIARTKVLWKWFGSELTATLSAALTRTRNQYGLWGKGNPQVLDTAFAVLCYERLGASFSQCETAVSFLCESQLADGGWCWAPLFSDGSGCWFGHRVVTTLAVMRAAQYLGLLSSGSHAEVRTHA